MPKCDTTKAKTAGLPAGNFVTELGAIMQINWNRSYSALFATGGLIPIVFASLFLFLSGTVEAACVDGINDKNGKPCGGSGDDDAKVNIDQLQHQFNIPVSDILSP